MPKAYLDFKYERTTTMNGVYDNAFTITSLENNNTIAFNQDLSNAGFIYSLDGGMSWQSVSSATICTLNAGESVMIRNTSPILSAFSCPWPRLFSTEMKDFNVSGNIMSLLTDDYKNFKSLHYVDEEEELDFYFSYILQYTFAGTNIIDASNLILPATELAPYCYINMFDGCTKLEKPPKLPATTLADYCYAYMFNGCTSLTTAPTLPATILASNCYMYMFQDCTSLAATPEFPDFEFAEGAESSCEYMFKGCESIVSGPVLSCDNLTTNCYKAMFLSCTNMVNPPVLKATNLAYGCYESMFEYCSSLVNAPELPAIQLPERCYAFMFRHCTNLSYIKIYAITREDNSLYDNSLYNWVDDVAPTGVFIKQQGVTYPINSIDGVPIGWTIYDLGDQIYDIYAVSLSVDPEGAGTVSGAGRYIRTTDVTVTALPDNDYLFDHWEVNGINVSNEAIYTFRMNYDIHLTAKFVTDTNIYSDMYFTIQSVSNNNSIYIRTYETDDPFKIYYKVNDVWNSIDISEPQNEDILITTLNKSETLCLASNKESWDVQTSIAQANGGRIVTTKNYIVYGNLLSMVLYDEEGEMDDSVFYYDEYYEVPTACFRNFFRGSTTNVSNLLNAANLSLPSYTVEEHAYAGMFRNCTKLLYAPKRLYATTLDDYCYYAMFMGCTSLITVPILNAPILESNCYYCMFMYCTSLTTAPTLSATTLADYCYASMFLGCTSLTTAPTLPATTLASSCYEEMFSGCTSLTTVPTNMLPATSLAQYCYLSMFEGCTSLTTVPTNMLPATSLSSAIGCYLAMFEGCTSLTTAPTLSSISLEKYCYAYMFYGCTSLTTAPDLPSALLKEGCYSNMFYNCENLNYIRILALIRATDDIKDWVHNVAPTGIFVKDYNTEYLIDNDSGVPIGWTIVNDESSHIFYNIRIINNHPTLGEVFGAGRYESGDTVTIRAIPAQGHSFKNWKYNNVIISTSAEYSFTATQDVTIVVTWDIEHIYENEYLTIESLSNDNKICLYGHWNEYGYNFGAGTIQYCINDNQYWTTYSLTNDKNDYVCTLNEGDCIKLKNIQYMVPWTTSDTNEYLYKLSIVCSKQYNVYGNIMSLYNAHLNEEQSTISHYVGKNLLVLANNERFSYIFGSNLVSVKNLILPATTLSPYCYSNMFNGCTVLLDVPELPATTLADYCYCGMFSNCIALPSIPSDLLPATTLARHCYHDMFYHCYSLVSIPSGLLPATTLADGCYLGMFMMMTGDNYFYNLNQTALTTVPSDLLPATTLAERCYMRMFQGCTSLTTTPDLPATSLKEQCYEYMFMACTSLTTAPDLPATEFSDWHMTTYYHMFEYCTSLNYIKAMFKYTARGPVSDPTYIPYWTYDWVQYVSSTGTFVRNIDANMERMHIGVHGIPSGWTVTTASE